MGYQLLARIMTWSRYLCASLTVVIVLPVVFASTGIVAADTIPYGGGNYDSRLYGGTDTTAPDSTNSPTHQSSDISSTPNKDTTNPPNTTPGNTNKNQQAHTDNASQGPFNPGQYVELVVGMILVTLGLALFFWLHLRKRAR